MKQLIKSSGIKDVIISTKSFIAWAGSVEDEWRNIVRELLNFTEKSFFLNTANDYEVECGWYLKLVDLKPLIENLYEIILKEKNYKSASYMINQYNKIVSHINNEIGVKYFDECCSCDNNYCIFSISGICCNKNQHGIDGAEPNELDCDISIRSDYYDLVKFLRNTASNEIRYMELEQLIDFKNRYL